MKLPKQGNPNTCELFEDISGVSGLGPAHLGRQIRVFPPKLTLAYRSVIGRAIQWLQPINIVANLNSDHMRSGLSLGRIRASWCLARGGLHVGDFSPSAYEHVLPEGAHGFDDCDSECEEKHPGLGFADGQVEAEVARLDLGDRGFYGEYRGFLGAYCRQHGGIVGVPDLIELVMTGRCPGVPSAARKEQEGLQG